MSDVGPPTANPPPCGPLPILPYSHAQTRHPHCPEDLHFPSRLRDLYSPLAVLTAGIGLSFFAFHEETFGETLVTLAKSLPVVTALSLIIGFAVAVLTRFGVGPWGSAALKLSALGLFSVAVFISALRSMFCFGLIFGWPIATVVFWVLVTWFFEIDFLEGLFFSVVACGVGFATSSLWLWFVVRNWL